MTLNKEQIDQFFTNGFLVLDSFLDESELREFEEESISLIDFIKFKRLDIIKDLGCIIEPWIYFLKIIDNQTQLAYKNYKLNLKDFNNLRSWGSEFNLVNFIKKKVLNLIKPLFLNIDKNCKDIYLFNEQYIVKPSDSTTKFQLHKDSEHLPKYCQNIFNLAIWINLDEINESSGYFNFKNLRNSSIFTQLELKPGSIVLIHSDCYHYSDPNKSSKLRRAYMIQFTKEALYLEEEKQEDKNLISLGVKIKI